MSDDYTKAKSIDDELDEDDATELAMRKLLYTVVDTDVDNIETGPVEAAERFVDVITDLRRENERLRERVAELEATVTPQPDRAAYDDLTRAEKIQKIRESLVESAASRHNGRFAMEYTDVKWLFDNNPSDGHAYDLMRLTSEADGFAFESPENSKKRVTVNIDAVNDEAHFHAAKNRVSQQGV